MSKSPSLRRIQADIRELALDPSDRYHAAPLETDMFEWHFTIRGADGTDFEGGVYHGRIMLPPEYPFKPPHIIFLTPSGRFETNTKVCLSFSAYHPELWQPAWGIRLILEALISFLPTPADGAIGALDWTSAERKRLAKKSVDYFCPVCGVKPIELLPKLKPKSEADDENNNSKTKSRFQKEIEKLQQLQHAQHAVEEEKTSGTDKTEEKGSQAQAQEPAQKENNGNKTTATTTTDEKEAVVVVKEETANITEPQPEDKEVAVGKTEPSPPVPPVQPSTSAEAQPTAANVSQSQPPPPLVEDHQPLPGIQQQQQQETVPLMPAAAVVPPVAPPAPQQQVAMQDPNDDGILSWMVDPVLHGIIIVLSILCFLLLRKLQAMMEELDALNQVLEG